MSFEIFTSFILSCSTKQSAYYIFIDFYKKNKTEIYVILKNEVLTTGFMLNLSLTESIHLEKSCFIRLFERIKSKNPKDEINASFSLSKFMQPPTQHRVIVTSECQRHSVIFKGGRLVYTNLFCLG